MKSGCSGIEELQEVDLQVYSHAECVEYYGNGPTEDMICSGIPQGSNGICSGDSGGPLLVDGIQIGITSWTSIFCDVYPGVWTKVSHYRNWIKENTGV
ncbi:Prostate-specific antigen [Blattella germanica]|nr:Prostate-specific antigen [Blattella germanica]